VKNDDEKGLHRFAAHTKALELFDFVVGDMSALTAKGELTRMISQQLASADSIASNIEEGYGRSSKKEYLQFLIIARGSAQETMGRYGRFKHWLPPATVDLRIQLCGEIIAILTATIKTLRARISAEKSPQ
jgi:four helix bundle protein